MSHRVRWQRTCAISALVLGSRQLRAQVPPLVPGTTTNASATVGQTQGPSCAGQRLGRALPIATTCGFSGAFGQANTFSMVGPGGVLFDSLTLTGPTSALGLPFTLVASSTNVWQSAISACYSTTPGNNGCLGGATPFVGAIVFGGPIVGGWTLTPPISTNSFAEADISVASRFSADDLNWNLGFGFENEDVTTNLGGVVSGGGANLVQTQIFSSSLTTFFQIGIFAQAVLSDASGLGTGGSVTNFWSLPFRQVRFEALSGGVLTDVTDQVSYSFAAEPVTATPEPGSMALTATGIAGLAGWWRRRRGRAQSDRADTR